MFLNQYIFNISCDSEKETLDISNDIISQNKLSNMIENLVLDDSHKILFLKNFELLKAKYKKNVKSVFNVDDLKKSYFGKENSENDLYKT